MYTGDFIISEKLACKAFLNMKLKLHLESQSNSEKACFSIYLVKRNNGDRKSAVFTHAKPKENLFFFFFQPSAHGLGSCDWE